MAKILAFAGSARKDSWNIKLAKFVGDASRDAGAEVTFLNLGDLDLPMFCEDLEREHGAPAGATRLKELLVAHDGMIISSPEYNSSVSALLKNAIDWASRPAPNEPPLVAFRGKAAGLCAASPGVIGGLRGLFHLRDILQNIGVTVVPDMAAVGKAHEVFDSAGKITDERLAGMASGVGRAVAKTAALMRG